jgi:uncharacterized protein
MKKVKKNDKTTFIKRLLFWLTGIIIISLGASLTIKADIGTGAWDALNVGLSNLFHLTIGTFVIIIGITLLFFNAWLVKRKPEYLSLFTIFIVGSLIDFWMLIGLGQLELTTYIYKLITLVGGLLIVGMGVAIYLQPKFPLNPIDHFMMAVSQKFGVSLVVAKTISEIVALVLALIVSGPIGFGTIIVTVGIGPSIQLFVPFFERIAYRFGIKN